MITVNVYKNKQGFQGFCCQGHAGFDSLGKDIVCAAVSMLVINTVNSIEAFTREKVRISSGDGRISLSFEEAPGERAALLMDSMLLGLTETERNYGGKYLKLTVKEV